MAKIKKDVCTEICWKCGSKDLMKSNEGKLIHCKSCGHGYELKESVKKPGTMTTRRY